MKSSNSKTIHIISQAHLDLAWLWTWKESWSEVLNNLHSVTRLMEQYEDLKFSYSSSILYQWVQESSPRLFETGGIKDTVRVRLTALNSVIEETILPWQILTLHLTHESGIWLHRVISMLEE